MTIGKKIFFMLLAVIGLTIGAGILYAATVLNYSDSALLKTYKKLDGSAEEDNIIEATEPITILLMGVDTSQTRGGAWEGGRSDTMIVVTVNPETKKTTMVSLPRDIMVNITDPDGTATGTLEKLNHSYSYGQAPMAVATIEKMLDIDINRYVQINMDGLVELVNKLGGITVNNTLGFPISIAEQEPGYTAVIQPGVQLINGEQALVYARMRYDDPEGDYGRQKRQREVIAAVLNKLLQLDGFTKYKGILDAVSNNMQTDIEISSSTMNSLLGYRDSLNAIESYQLDGEGEMVDGLSYQIPTSQHLFEIQNIIKTSLGLPAATELRTNVQTLELLFGGSSPVNIVDVYTGTTLVEGTGDFTTSTITSSSDTSTTSSSSTASSDSQ